jgi:hypothetical protein
MNNMMNAIATVPRLYTQVLHLMNKMNLPPPFGPASPAATPSLVSTLLYITDDHDSWVALLKAQAKTR